MFTPLLPLILTTPQTEVLRVLRDEHCLQYRTLQQLTGALIPWIMEMQELGLVTLDSQRNLDDPSHVCITAYGQQYVDEVMDREAPAVGLDQALIAFGKFAHGYRPGDEGWNDRDEAALGAAVKSPFPDTLMTHTHGVAQEPPGESVGAAADGEQMIASSIEHVAQGLHAVQLEMIGQCLDRYEHATAALCNAVMSMTEVLGHIRVVADEPRR